MNWRRLTLALAVLGCSTLGIGSARAELTGDEVKAARIRDLTLELSVESASKELVGADPNDQWLDVERARLAIYRGDCELAVGILAGHGLTEVEAGSDGLSGLATIARGCARSTAGVVSFEDKEHGVLIRFQDDLDVVLGPSIASVAAKARELYKVDLGTELPNPIRIDVVRDQFALAAMTGLPVEAARTTGTIAIAKWGHVIMLSPRGAPHGYAYLDTLAHELSHLAQTRASKDRAPLWLQEGVARIEETRWRAAQPFDDVPSADDLSAFGIENHIGPAIDQIGPSIAMLSSAEEAQVTYGKVMSFIRYWSKAEGDGALPRLLSKMGEANTSAEIERSIADVSGKTFADWRTAWEKEILANKKELPFDLRPGSPPAKNLGEIRKKVRLGELFEDRKHPNAAKKELSRAFELEPREAAVRVLLAKALLALGDKDGAAKMVEKITDVRSNDPRWWALHAVLFPSDAKDSFDIASRLDPLDPVIACRSLDGENTELTPAERELCDTAKRRPNE